MRRHKVGALLALLALMFVTVSIFLVTQLGACEQQGGRITTNGYCAGRTHTP